MEAFLTAAVWAESNGTLNEWSRHVPKRTSNGVVEDLMWALLRFTQPLELEAVYR